MFGRLLVEEAKRMRKLLDREHVETPAVPTSREGRRMFVAAIEHQNARAFMRSGVVRGCCVRHMMRDEADARGIEPGKRRLQEPGRSLRIQRSKPFPAVRHDVAVVEGCERRIVAVGDGIQILGPETRLAEAPPRRLLRQLPRGERHGQLAVLATREALLLGRCNDIAVDDESRRMVVERSIDTEDAHVVEVPEADEQKRLSTSIWTSGSRN